MKVYLAAPYSSRLTMADYVDELERMGIQSTATWINGTHETDADATPEELASWALDDLRDLRNADVLVSFTAAAVGQDTSKGQSVSGGRHVELGYWVGNAKGNRHIILVGQPENVFHRLPGITIVEDWHEAVLELAARHADDRRPRVMSG